MAADTPFRTYVPLPTNPASGNDKSSEYILSEVPIHIITDPSQLPPEILCPSPGKEQVIGFDCERVDLSRYGVLCIMQIASQDAVYIIDAFQGGDKLMQACKPVLESDLVTKVIHDCKRDSEALYFQFGIKLHNVMDTQIAYNLFEEQEGRPRSEIEYISFVDLLADRRYCDSRPCFSLNPALHFVGGGPPPHSPPLLRRRQPSTPLAFAPAHSVRLHPARLRPAWLHPGSPATLHLIGSSQVKERAEKLEYWKTRQNKIAAKKNEKKELLLRQSSVWVWVEEHELEKKVLNVIIDTTPF